jgi:alpha-tubulin suppressor-like RCC1 family protein
MRRGPVCSLTLVVVSALNCGHESTAPGVVAARLAFSTAPVSGAAGRTISPAIVVTAQEANGNPDVTTFAGMVTLAFGANPGASTLSGTLTVAAVDGVATFDDIRINKVGVGYTLVASSGALTPATSAAFTIAGAPATLTKSGADGQSGLAHGALAAPLSVTITDAFGNGVPGVSVQWAAVTGGGSVGAPASVTNAFGVATIPWTLGATAGSQTATAAIAGLAGSPATFTATASPFSFTTLAAGGDHTCGLAMGGAAFCWGDNSYGALGDGTTTLRLAPMPVAGGLLFTSLVAGLDHTCALTAGGAAYCWGFNQYGAVGDGTTAQRVTPTPVAGGVAFASLAAGFIHTCGLTAGGVAYCWGDNTFGELGDGTTTSHLTPVAVQGGLLFTTLTATGAAFHTCGLTAGGAAYCWGYNGYAELGDGTTINRLAPTPVASGLVFTSLAAGGYSTCGLVAAGTPYCWGRGDSGELGDGAQIERPIPVAVAGSLAFASLAGGGFHSCGVTAAGAAYCWGFNQYGELGAGTTAPLGPVAVQAGLVLTSLAAADYHSCGLTAAGAPYCWGLNDSGELGDGTTTNRYGPVPVIP